MEHLYVLMLNSYDSGAVLGVALTLEECQKAAERTFAADLKQWQSYYEGKMRSRRRELTTALDWRDAESGLSPNEVMRATMPRNTEWLSIYRLTPGEFRADAL